MTEGRRSVDAGGDSALAQALREARAQLGAPERMRALHATLAQRLAAPNADAASGTARASGVSVAKIWFVLAAALVGLGVLYQRSVSVPNSTPTQHARSVAANPTTTDAASGPNEAPHVEAATQAAPAITAPARARARAALERHARRAQPSVTATTPASPALDPDAEVALISSAQQALERDPRRALAALDEHERRFARGVLAEEREVLRFDALVALGQSSQARQRAQAFVARFPSSPQRARLQNWLDTQRDAALVRNPGTPHTPTERIPSTEEAR